VLDTNSRPVFILPGSPRGSPAWRRM